MKVRELLCDESKWTRHAWARDRFGQPTFSTADNAVSFCLIGAVNHCYQDDEREQVLDKLSQAAGTNNLVFFSDRATTFADIRRVLELADV